VTSFLNPKLLRRAIFYGEAERGREEENVPELARRPDQDLVVLQHDHQVRCDPGTRQPSQPILDDIDRPEEALTSNVADHIRMFSLQRNKN
jgi:hypothetical protein